MRSADRNGYCCEPPPADAPVGAPSGDLDPAGRMRRSCGDTVAASRTDETSAAPSQPPPPAPAGGGPAPTHVCERCRSTFRPAAKAGSLGLEILLWTMALMIFGLAYFFFGTMGGILGGIPLAFAGGYGLLRTTSRRRACPACGSLEIARIR